MQSMIAVLSQRVSLAFVPLTAALLATVAAPDAVAKPKICPQFLAKYCVMNKADLIYTAWTNPCFASEQGLRILYAGACKFGPLKPPRT